ncbi:DUF3373 family protein [Sulfurimonas sp.]
MKKIILLTIFSTLLLSSDSELLKRIEALEKELLTLKMMAVQNNKEIKKTIPEIKIAVEENTQEIQDNAPILEKTERKTILDKLNLSPELEIRVDQFDYKVGNIAGENTLIYSGPYTGQTRRTNYSKHFDPAAAIKFRINMDAKVDKQLSFHGNLLFSTSSQSNQRLCILSRDIKSQTSTSAFDVERAYFDYVPNISSKYPFTLSAGLLPTTGGTPMQFAQNTKRKSMFPALVFDMNTYGIIGTQKIAKDTFVRAIAAKAYTLRAAYYPYQCNRENIDNADIIGLYADTKFDFLGDSLLSFGVNLLHDFKAHPYLGPDVGSSDAHNLGNIFTYGLGIDIQKFISDDITFFAHSALSNPHGNGAIDDYQIAADGDVSDGLTASGITGFSEASYAQGTMIKSDGYSFYTGAKYGITPTINIGAEYNYGSKYWFSATQGAEDMYNKLATRGHVGEIYGMWKFHKNLQTKIGYMYTNENYTGSGWHFGEPVSKDGTQSVGYMTLKAKF